MAVARMKRVTIFATQELKERIFEELRDLGIMQVTQERDRPLRFERSSPDAFSAEISKLTYLKDYFEKYNPVKKSFIDMFTGKKPEVTLDEIHRKVESYDIDKVFSEVKRHEDRLGAIDDELSSILDHVAALTPWTSLDLPLAKTGATRDTDNLLAVMPLSSSEKFSSEMADRPVHYERVFEERSRVGLWVVGLRTTGEMLSSTVVASGGTVYDVRPLLAILDRIGAESTLVPDALEALHMREAQLQEERKRIVDEDLALSQELVSVLSLIDYFLDKKNLCEVRDSTGTTIYTLVIEGWVKARDIALLRERLGAFEGVGIVDEDPVETSCVPVYLENHPIIKPFEVITNIYGYPTYDEIDPTPFLAPFFWLFFGMCLGDAVYGIVLSLGAWYFLKTQKLAEGGVKFVKLMMYSGLSTILAGALTASWMGDLASVFLAGSFVEKVVNGIAILNPIEDPLTMLVISFGFGIFQVWVGTGVKMLGFIKKGQTKEGILSCGSWMLFLPGLILWAVSKAGVMDGTVPFYIMLAGALMVMYSSSRSQKNILLKPFTGLYGLYGTISYFSDTMSYSRLLALGLASAIIGMVVNKIAALLAGMIPVVGWLLVPVVLLGGHLFNLVINVLGSFIHAGRLQFVEFFTKFFEGGGRPFKPLTRVNENVSLSD